MTAIRRTPLLALKKLEVAYGGIHAVKGIDLEVGQGELVCLIGANGAGKTTTLKGICGLLPVKAGTIHYAGENITGKPAFRLVQRGLAMVPEGRGVFGALTIEENLAMGAYIRSDNAGIKADIERVFHLFPRLKERRRQTAGTLSGGEQQMLAMGRAMMSRPKLLLLDEPSMGLAPLMVQKVFETIRTMSGRRRDDPADRAEREARARGEPTRLRDGVGRDHARGRGEIPPARPEGARGLPGRDDRVVTRSRRPFIRPMHDVPQRPVRAVPAAHAWTWFAEAMRLWKRGPATFCAIACIVVLLGIVADPIPVVGLLVANVVSPLLGTGLLFASLAADRGEPPRLRHMIAIFVAPAAAVLAVVAAALVIFAAEAVAASDAGRREPVRTARGCERRHRRYDHRDLRRRASPHRCP